MKTWKTITINKKPSTEGIQISDWAEDMLKKVKWNKKQRIDLVRITVGELFNDTNLHTTDEIYAKAKKKGLSLCPPQVGLQLRVDYKDQPMNEWLYMVMKPITDSYGGPHVFKLGRRDGGLWLYSIWANPGNAWHPLHEFVFSLRKSLKLKPLDPSSDTYIKCKECKGTGYIKYE